MIAFLIYFIITVATTPVGTSHLSHVGGFVTGLFPAMMFLPHLKSQRCDFIDPVLHLHDSDGPGIVSSSEGKQCPLRLMLSSKRNQAKKNDQASCTACRFEAWIPILGALVTIVVFVALPTYFYTHKYPHLGNCGADLSRYY